MFTVDYSFKMQPKTTKCEPKVSAIGPYKTLGLLWLGVGTFLFKYSRP